MSWGPANVGASAAAGAGFLLAALLAGGPAAAQEPAASGPSGAQRMRERLEQVIESGGITNDPYMYLSWRRACGRGSHR